MAIIGIVFIILAFLLNIIYVDLLITGIIILVIGIIGCLFIGLYWDIRIADYDKIFIFYRRYYIVLSFITGTILTLIGIGLFYAKFKILIPATFFLILGIIVFLLGILRLIREHKKKLKMKVN